MSWLSQSNALRANAASTIENPQGSPSRLAFNEGAQNAGLPLNRLCPVLKHQMVAFRKLVLNIAINVCVMNPLPTTEPCRSDLQQ